MSKSIAVLGSDSVPLKYTVPVPGSLTALAASAVYDGSASSSFLPALSFYDNDGNLIARATAPEVTGGESAEISWFPRVAQAATGGGGEGLQFNNGTYGPDNEGDWFFGAANDAAGGPNGYSWQFDTGSSDRPIGLTGDGGAVIGSGSGDVTVNGARVTVETNGGTDSVIVTLEAGPGALCTFLASITQSGGTFTVADSIGNPIFQLVG